MREDELRDRLREALGETPRLRTPELRPATAELPRSHTGLMALVAVGLAIAIVVGLVGARVVLRPQGAIVPGAQPSPAATATTSAAGAFPCALPVVVTTEPQSANGSPAVTQAGGFVNLPSGQLRMDPNATIADLPHNAGDAPTTYSAALSRWLPEIAMRVSPGGTEYAYVAQGAGSSQLHVVNARTRADRVVWSFGEGIDVILWTDSGIIADTVPFAGGILRLWRVDPSSGAVSQLPDTADPTKFPIASAPNGTSIAYMGGDAQGRAVFRIGSRDPGTKYTVVIVQSDRVIATLYSGTQGDARDFDPAGVYFDAHGLWMGNADGTRVWLWSAAQGLRSFALTGLPANDQGAFISVVPAGPCIPGSFGGVAASPVPPPPSPSPTPVVDWSPFLARPLSLPSASAGSCPASPQTTLDVHAQSGKNGPDYGYGQGPAYVTGQINWYSAGSQGIGVLVDPEYKGPVLVRVKQIDGGDGAVTITGLGEDLGAGEVGIPELAPAPYWGVNFGGVTFSAPGCYGIQLDGTNFSDYAVITVVTGPPPPG